MVVVVVFVGRLFVLCAESCVVRRLFIYALCAECWSAVANYQSGDMTAPYISKDVRDQAQLFADQRSSVSVIRYWKLSEKDKQLPTPEQLAIVKREEEEREAKLNAKSTDSKSGGSKSAPTANTASASEKTAESPPAAATASTTTVTATATATATAAADGKTKADTNSAGDNGVLTLPAELPTPAKDSQFDESVHVPCGIHTDTGMLTFIICAPVAGLQIQNRFPNHTDPTQQPAADHKKPPTPEAEAVDEGYGVEKPGTVTNWLDVEKTCEVGVDLFVIAGRKCSLFAHGMCDERNTASLIECF